MNTVNLSILGFPAANRDLTVEVRDPVSASIVATAVPFLDGTVKLAVPNPGAYEMVLSHANVPLPVLRRPIRVLPTPETQVSVLLDPSKFQFKAVEDIPEANLRPVRDTMDSVAETVLPLTRKQPGEAIRAADFNALGGAIHDLAASMSEMTRLVSPTGHDHPEFLAKFDEITTNFQTLLNTLTAAMTELQRQIQAQRFRTQVTDVLDVAQVDPKSNQGREILSLIDQLDVNVTQSPTTFGRTAREVGVALTTKVEQLIDDRGGDPDFINSTPVQNLVQSADLLKAQRTTTYDTEIEHHRMTDRVFGTGGLSDFRAKV